MTDDTDNIIPIFGHPPADNSGLHELAGAPANDDDGWMDHAAIITVYLATAILCGWAEGKTLTLPDCCDAMPELASYVDASDFERATHHATLIAASTGMTIPQPEPEEPRT